MPRQKRFKTGYPGVTYVLGVGVGKRKREKIFYIRYYKRKNDVTIEVEEKPDGSIRMI